MDWHRRMYDRVYALEALSSAEMRAEAEAEVDFILRETGLGAHARALDIACGTGRHSGALAARGLDVVGVDINPSCLQIAKESYPGPRFVEGDMADLQDYRASSELVLCMYSSVGYFADDTQNLAAFEQMAAALRPPGFLVIQAIELGWLSANYRPVKSTTAGSVFTLEARTFDHETRYNEANRIVLDEATGQARRYYVRDRVYAAEEMCELLLGLGSAKVTTYGSDGTVFSPSETSHPVYIAEFG